MVGLFFPGLWIRIQWGVWIRIQNPDPGSRSKKKARKILTFLIIFITFFKLNFPFAAHTNTVLLPIISGAAEPHHFDEAPAPCKNFNAAPTLVRILLHCKVPYANLLETNIS
jgi:hypothetical protein